jgi:hypothetical protein
MKHFYILIFSIFLSCSVLAQVKDPNKPLDVIYMMEGKQEYAQIQEISSEKETIKYKNTNTYAVTKGKTKGVVLAFNIWGNYLVIQGGLFSDAESKDFIARKEIKRPNDLIINSDEEVTAAKITSESGDFVTGIAKGVVFKTKRTDLIAIIRKNGSHQLFVNPEKAVAALLKVKPLIAARLDMPEETEPVSTQNMPVAGTSIPATPPVTTPAPSVKMPPAIVPISAPVNSAPANAAVTTHPAVTPVPPTSTAATPAPLVIAHVDAPKTDVKTNATTIQFDQALFTQKSQQKLQDFKDNLDIIVDKDASLDKIDKSISSACSLFTDVAQVEVSSLHTQSHKYGVKKYLDNLALNSKKYDHVIIDYADFTYATKFTLNPDGTSYSAVISFVQHYQAIQDKKIVYEDYTKRNITVTVKKYEKLVASGIQTEWDVYLGNLSVSQTARKM